MLRKDIIEGQSYWYFNTAILLTLPSIIKVKDVFEKTIYYKDEYRNIRVANSTITDDMFLTEEDALIRFMTIYHKAEELNVEVFVAEDENFKIKQRYILDKYPERFI